MVNNRILVAYVTKMGSTREIPEKIAEELGNSGFEVVVEPCQKAASVDGFAAVVIGSALYLRRWIRQATRYLRRQAPHLARRPTYLFQSGPIGQERSQSVVRAPRGVRRVADHIRATGPVTFGGRLDRSKATGLISRWVATSNLAGDYRDWAAISAWAQSIAAELQVRIASQPSDDESESTSKPRSRRGVMSGARRDMASGEWGEEPPTTRLTPLSRSECEELLAANTVGRIAWHSSTGLQLLPVSYVWHEGRIVFRTSPQGVLAELAQAQDVVFEVDVLDQRSHTGQSVVVSGGAQGVTSPAELTELWGGEGAVPWAAGVRDLFISITPSRITGRSLSRET